MMNNVIQFRRHREGDHAGPEPVVTRAELNSLMRIIREVSRKYVDKPQWEVLSAILNHVVRPEKLTFNIDNFLDCDLVDRMRYRTNGSHDQRFIFDAVIHLYRSGVLGSNEEFMCNEPPTEGLSPEQLRYYRGPAVDVVTAGSASTYTVNFDEIIREHLTQKKPHTKRYQDLDALRDRIVTSLDELGFRFQRLGRVKYFAYWLEREYCELECVADDHYQWSLRQKGRDPWKCDRRPSWRR